MKLPIHIRNTRTSRIILSCLFIAILFSQKTFAQPTISSISPTNAAVGATLTITGTNFDASPANNAVFFGPVKATVTAATVTSLTVTVPSGAAYGQINVINVTAGLSATSSQFFTPVFSPNKPGLIAADITVQGSITGSTPGYLKSIGASDLDNDGKPDLVITGGNPGDARAYIRKNTSTTTSVAFGASITVTVNGGLSGPGNQISFGDLNGDSRPDIVLPGGDANAFVILKNNGGLSFSSSIVSSALNTAGTVVSDLDLDGKPDIVVSNYGSSHIIAYPNTTVTPTSITMGAGITMTGSLFQTNQLVTADLDGDGKSEIIAPQISANTIHFYRNTSTPGSISFGSRQSKDVHVDNSHNASFIAVADLNNDGKPDMVVTDGASTATSIAILRNTSVVNSISFSLTNQVIGTDYNQGSVAFADMNGDGKPDLVIGMDKDFDPGGGLEFRIAVLYNTSVGDDISFSLPIEYVSGTTAIGYSVIATDMNADGVPDILAPGGNSGNISAYRGSLQFAPTISSVTPLNAAPGSSVVISGTGFNATAGNNTVLFGGVKATLTAASTTSLTATVPVNASYAPITVLNKSNTLSASSPRFFSPAFTPNKPSLAVTDFVEQSVLSTTGELYGMAAGDLTGDGKPELVVTNSASTSSLLIYGNISTIGGPVSFGAPTAFTPTSGYDRGLYVSLADMDGNGWLDIVVPSYNLSTVGVFLNSGTGVVSTAFTLTGSFETGEGPIGVATGDLDGDGKPDMVTANNRGQSVSVFRNISTAINAVSFAPKQDYLISATDAVFNLSLADIDNDGKLDIISGHDINGTFGKVVLFRNTSTVGNISFAAAVEIAGTNAPWGFVPGDLNGDGFTDFIVGAGGSGATDIFAYTKLSSGGALTNLGTTQLTTTLGGSIAIGLADLNGDGKPDVISGTKSASPGFHTYIYPNTTSGTSTSFGTRLDLPATVRPWSTVTTDMNGDGRPDIIMGNQVNSSGSSVTIFRNTLIAPPVTQATGITVTSLTGTTATFSWTNGSGSKRAVFIKADNTGTAAPVTGTDYTANTVFGSGAQIGSTGWFCVYNGTGNSVNVTGLTPSTGYIAMVTEFNDGGLSNTAQYNTNAATNNPITLTARATVTAISRTTASATINTNTADFRISFNANMTGLTTSNFNIVSTGITAPSVTAVTGSGTVFTVTANTGNGSGTLGLNLANTTGMVPGVTNTLAYTGEVYTIDKTPPTLLPVTIVSNNSNTAMAKTGDVITLSFTASETINTPTVTIAGNAATVSNTSANNWTASYTMAGADPQGTITFTISFSDVNGNVGTSVTATTNSTTVNYDRTDPVLLSVGIASNNVNVALAKAGDVITINFTSGETLLAASATIAGNAATVSNVGGNNWKAVYTMVAGDASGVVPFSISFSDLAGNAGIAVTTTSNSSNVNYDKTDPVLSSVGIVSNNVNAALAKAGDVVTINFTSGEALLTASATIAGNAATVSNVSGNNWKAVYTMASGNATGIIPFSISFSDLAGNAGTAVTVTTNNSNVNYDRTDPVLLSVGIASNNGNAALAKAGDVVTINFTSGETLLTASATIAGNAATVSNVGGNNWKAVYTMAAGDAGGVIPFSISFSDLTGNAGTAVTATTNSSNVNYDRTDPVLSTVVIGSNNANGSLAKTGDVITINFTANEALTTPIVTIAGHAVIATNISGNSYTAAYTMVSGDASGTVSFSISFGDIAGNIGSSVSATTNSSSVTFDKIAPTVTSVNRLVPLTQDFSGAGSVTYRVSFSEAVKNVTTVAFQLTQLSGSISGTIASVSASTGSAIDVTINNFTGSGSFRMDLKSSGTGITDNAGNTISGGFVGGQSYGSNTAPLITAGAVQSLVICQGLNTATSLDNMLMATDIDNGQTLTWTVQSGPSHGALSGFPATVTVVNGLLIPSGLTYLANALYSGTDAFVIQVSDGSVTATTTINVTVNPMPAVTLTASQGTILCGNSASLNIDAVSGHVYVWYKNTVAISGVSTAQLTINSIGTYTATATSAAGCVANATNSITITQLQKPTANFSFDSYCTNNPVSFTNLSVTNNSGPVTYAWTDGNGNTNASTAPVFTYTQAGSYTVKLKITPTNCPTIADSISKIIQVEAPAAATRLANLDIAAGKPVQLTARTFPASYTWLPSTGLSAANIVNPSVSLSGAVQYTIAMKVASGCITTDTLLVRVFGQNDIYVANVFTPNGDGVNDKLIVNLVGVKNFHFFRVFNKQGKKIFETMNPFEGWDGKVNGVLQPLDTYVWIAEGSDQNGAIIHKQGSTTLIR